MSLFPNGLAVGLCEISRHRCELTGVLGRSEIMPLPLGWTGQRQQCRRRCRFI